MTKPLRDALLTTAPRNKSMLAGLVAAGVLLMASCAGKDEGQARGPGGPPAVVTTIVLAPAPWSDSIEALGTAVARESLAITAKVSETVAQVRFESGQAVSAGQVLVTLSDRAEVAGLGEAAAAYRESQALLERQQSLAKRQLVAASQLDVQRAARDSAKGRLDQLRAQVSDRVITAPFDGVLGLRQVSPGSLVTPGTVITTLDDISTINLDFSVPERQLSSLSVGQAIVATSDAFPGEQFTGAITSVGSRVDPTTRSLAARAAFDNASGKLRAGMLLRVRLQQASRNVLQVPELSLQQVGRQAFVFRVGAEDKVDQVPVRIGSRRPGWVEILDGVKAGDRIVVEGIVKLKPGATVTEAGAAPAQPASPAKPGP